MESPRTNTLFLCLFVLLLTLAKRSVQQRKMIMKSEDAQIAEVTFLFNWVGCALQAPAPHPGPRLPGNSPSGRHLRYFILILGFFSHGWLPRCESSWRTGCPARLWIRGPCPRIQLQPRCDFPVWQTNGACRHIVCVPWRTAKVQWLHFLTIIFLHPLRSPTCCACRAVVNGFDYVLEAQRPS